MNDTVLPAPLHQRRQVPAAAPSLSGQPPKLGEALRGFGFHNYVVLMLHANLNCRLEAAI